MIIYKATNLVNGKMYVGKTAFSLEKRKREHKKNAQCLVCRSAFYSAIRKYGWENFKWEVVDSTMFQESLNVLEIYYIKKFHAKGVGGYNQSEGGEGQTGYRHSEETKKKISEKISGRKLSPSHIAKMKIVTIGRHVSEDGKRRISEANRGRVMSPETRKKMSDGHKGMVFSAETRKKISDRMSGAGNPMYGRTPTFSDDQRKKISESKKQYWANWREERLRNSI